MPARLPVMQAAPRIRKRVRRLLTTLQALIVLPAPTARDIHQLRRTTKKLRAWLKLHRGADKLQGSQHIERLLRENAARFAAQRDATVGLQTLDRLPQLAGSKPPRTGAALAHSRTLLSGQTPDAATQTDTRELQQALRHLLLAEPVPEAPDTLAGALRSTYRKARKLLRQARASRAAEDLHRFRRWAKYLCCQLELVCVPGRGPLAKLQRRLDALCAGLGTWHDLVVLEQRLAALRESAAAAGATTGELDLVQALCRKAQRRLLARCLRQAASCFRDKAQQLPVD